MQNSVYLAGCALARAVGHQSSGTHVLSQLIHRRQPVLRHEAHDPCDMNLIEGFGGHRQRIGALLDHCCETAEPAFRIALHFHQGVMERSRSPPSGSRDELKLRRGSLPAVTHSCGSFSLRRATADASQCDLTRVNARAKMTDEREVRRKSGAR